MRRDHIRAAMAKAHCETIDQPDDTFCGTIPGLRGTIAIGRSLEECRGKLDDALDGRRVFRLRQNLAAPGEECEHSARAPIHTLNSTWKMSPSCTR
jgi:hypothetical protein